MQIVIDVTEKEYEAIRLMNAVAEGTILPKGHGRLIDENQIKKCGMNFVNHHVKTDAPTILEADKAESEDKE